MERTNTFVVEGNQALWKLGNDCARLWNELNFERRQAYIRYNKFSWYPKSLHEKYASIIGSATVQQIMNKNNEAWKSLSLKRLGRQGKCVSMPRYWKRNGKRELRIIVRNDCYRLKKGFLKLPKGLRLRIKGKLKWIGKQGRLEIIYDGVDEAWRGFMAVKLEKLSRREGNKPLYIDLGVINLATLRLQGLKNPIAYSGKTILAEWWYWNKRIEKEQSRLARVNNAKASIKLRRFYRIRQRRFRHAINAMVKAIVEDAYRLGVSEIILGNLNF
ncbi:MAG: transposase [Candidatus Bathyarchaeia archaeon]